MPLLPWFSYSLLFFWKKNSCFAFSHAILDFFLFFTSYFWIYILPLCPPIFVCSFILSISPPPQYFWNTCQTVFFLPLACSLLVWALIVCVIVDKRCLKSEWMREWRQRREMRRRGHKWIRSKRALSAWKYSPLLHHWNDFPLLWESFYTPKACLS